MAHRIWPGTRALAQLHLDQGQRVWLVTAAPIEIAQIIARRLGLTGALGTVAEHVDGVYTGRLVGDMLHGPAKAEAVKALGGREGLDLSRCSAYSDSYNDLPMLTLVGDPCAINPDARLRAHAREQGWRIRDYRTGRKAARVGLVRRRGRRRRHRSRGGAVSLRGAGAEPRVWTTTIGRIRPFRRRVTRRVLRHSASPRFRDVISASTMAVGSRGEPRREGPTPMPRTGRRRARARRPA